MSPSHNSCGLHCLLVYTSCSTLYWRQPQRGDGRTSIKFTTGPAKKQLYFMHRTRWFVQNSSSHPLSYNSVCCIIIHALQFKCVCVLLPFSVECSLAGVLSTLPCTLATLLLWSSLWMWWNFLLSRRPRYRWTVCMSIRGYIYFMQTFSKLCSKQLVVTRNAIMVARRAGMSTVNNDWIISLLWPFAAIVVFWWRSDTGSKWSKSASRPKWSRELIIHCSPYLEWAGW